MSIKITSQENKLKKMKNFIRLFISLALLANTEILFGQDGEQSKYSIQLNLGISRTLHYNPTVNLIQCDEGCFPEEQKARFTPNINFNLYRDFNNKNSLMIGFGVSNYRYLERGQSDNGDGQSFSPYETINNWGFYGLSLGYRYIFHSENKINLIIENDFIYEIPIQEYELLKSGLAIQPKVGAILKLNDSWSIITEAFYKSALTIYSDKTFGKDYKPFAYGIQFGVNVKL